MSEPHFRFYETLRVFLACPGDLVAERSGFPRILDKVNTLRAHTMGFHLEMVGWERVVPSFGRPQELINRELLTADLTIVLFWNRLGVPSGAEKGVTGTQEEFELAAARCNGESAPDFSGNRPVLYVYFRNQTLPETESAEAVRAFRFSIEESKRLLYRQYNSESDWEDLITEHLVAFLNGRYRTDIEGAVDGLGPENPVMLGHFYWQAIYDHSKTLAAMFDFDGDDREEKVTFWFQQSGYWLMLAKDGSGGYVDIEPEFAEYLTGATRIHVAVKDVNNDGLPELLIAASTDGEATAMLGIFGWKDSGLSQIAALSGQNVIYVFERGHIAMPYGSVGFYTYYTWKDGKYDSEDREDPLRKISVFGRLG